MGWSVMVFAAGFGTRMKHLTKDRPKPLIEVASRPLIDHALALVDALPAAKTVVNAHYKADMLQHHLAGRNIDISVELPDILDTGGGLRKAVPLLGSSPVITLNSDVIWAGENPLPQLCKAWQPDKMDGLLMCARPENAVGFKGRGDFIIDGTGRVTRGDGVVYACAQIIKTERLKEIEKSSFSLNLLWDLLIEENRLYAIEYDGKWCDVGHPGGIALAEAVIGERHVSSQR